MYLQCVMVRAGYSREFFDSAVRGFHVLGQICETECELNNVNDRFAVTLPKDIYQWSKVVRAITL